MTSLFDRLQQEIDDRERQDGMSMLDLLDLSPELRNLVLLLARKGQMPADGLAAESGLPFEEVERLMESLAEQGLVRGFDLGERRFYRTYFGRRRHRGVGNDIWSRLDERTDDAPKS